MNERLSSYRVINGFTLKLIALITMTIDHTAYALGCGPLYLPMRYIGRIAFPIYCFLLVEGYLHTKSLKKYAGRLALAAVVSDLPFSLMCGCSWPNWYYQNVMFTLLIGLGAIWCLDHRRELVAHLTKDPVTEQICSTLLALAVIAVGSLLGDMLNVDYHSGGILLILAFFALRKHLLALILVTAYILYSCYGTIELYGLLALIPIALYNGKRGPMPGGKAGQWFFYWYYPLHIGILVLISAALGIASYTIF